MIVSENCKNFEFFNDFRRMFLTNFLSYLWSLIISLKFHIFKRAKTQIKALSDYFVFILNDYFDTYTYIRLLRPS